MAVPTTNLLLLFCSDDMASIFSFDDIIKFVRVVAPTNKGRGRRNLGRSGAGGWGYLPTVVN